ALLRLGVAPVAPAMRGEGLGERGGGGDRVPGTHRRAAIDGTERGGVIAGHENSFAHLVAALEPQPDGASELGLSPIPAEMQRVHIRLDQRVFAAELLADELLDRRRIHIYQYLANAVIN